VSFSRFGSGGNYPGWRAGNAVLARELLFLINGALVLNGITGVAKTAFGRGEEAEKILPAVIACRAKRRDVEGPLPADTLFFRAGRGDFDMVVGMYHDQGHAPIKVLGIEAGVDITVGLPVIRTSIDHGTAF
jgi:4-hydroxy-L-threonine phosphate dehydrogenase PdxA